MLVYHFVNAQFGLDDIRNRRLKIARIMDLNDPFEFLGVDLSDQQFRRALRETKTKLSKTKGILCFCKSWKNPVVWGHYADRHRGICLGFEVPSSILNRVAYVDSRLPRPDVPDVAFMKKLLLTKFAHWQYEQEYRVFVQLEEEIGGLYFSEFSDQLTLKRVIVGDQSSISRAEVSGALGDLETGVEVFKARAAFKSFNVVRNRDETMWV